MSARFLFPLLCFTMLTATPAASYDTLTQDYGICMGAKGSNGEIVDACTRLIENSAKENEIGAYFYGLRAIHNDDKDQNCSDAHKVMELAKDPKILDIGKTLIQNNC